MASGTRILPAQVPTLASLVWPASGTRDALWRAATLMVIGSLLLTVSAKVQVPFWPVPMTMQTLVVLVIGAAYGRLIGTATVVLYLLEGALGLPVFAGTPERGLGLAYMAGPTGGFLAGFVAAAFVTGFLAERGWDRSLLRVLAAMTIGHLVIFAFGLGWLGMLIGPAKAWMAGAAPFVVATLLKTGLAAALMQAAWTQVARSAKN